MKGVILVFAILLLSTPLHAETITLPGSGSTVADKIITMCLYRGVISVRQSGRDVWLKCGDATEFTVVKKGDSVTVTGHGPMVQAIFEGLKYGMSGFLAK